MFWEFGGTLPLQSPHFVVTNQPAGTDRDEICPDLLVRFVSLLRSCNCKSSVRKDWCSLNRKRTPLKIESMKVGSKGWEQDVSKKTVVSKSKTKQSSWGLTILGYKLCLFSLFWPSKKTNLKVPRKFLCFSCGKVSSATKSLLQKDSNHHLSRHPHHRSWDPSVLGPHDKTTPKCPK